MPIVFPFNGYGKALQLYFLPTLLTIRSGKFSQKHNYKYMAK